MAVTTKRYQFEPAQGWLDNKPTTDTYRYMQLDNKVEEVKTVVVHEFTMGDVDDPDLYAAQPLWEWQQTEKGQWVMTHAIETPSWYRIPDNLQYGYRYQIRAKLTGPRLTEYMLRHG